MDPIGKSPIPVAFLVLGKLAMACCLLFFLVKEPLADTLLYDSILTQGLGFLLIAAGLFIMILGFVALGRSVSVGLPAEQTDLKTSGILRITRNPLYLGAFVACAGSCLYAVHFANFLLCGLTIGIHHCIVLKEEKFLEQRFGNQWLDYKRDVYRYVGRKRETV